MVEGLEGPAREAPLPQGSSSSRSPFGLGLFLVAFTLGAVLATLALASALSFLGLWSALALGFFVAVGLTLFLALRVSNALKRRGTPALARHLLATLLALVTHLALFGVCLDWVGRSLGDVFLVADALVTRTVGDVPLLSGILRRGAEEATVSLDGEPLATRDGGPSAEGAPAGDGGPQAMAPAGDGGPAASVPSVLSPRSDVKRPVAGVVSLVRTDRGGYGAVVTTLDAGGHTSSRALDLTPFSADGGPVAADAARDGSAAFITGGGSVVYAGPDERPRALPSLARGTKLPAKPGSKDSRVLRAVRDVVIAPGGALLAVADVVIQSFNDPSDRGTVHPALLGYHPRAPGPVLVLRISGDPIPEAAEGSLSTGYELRRSGPAGRVAVVEAFLEGGDGASNDERLLAGRIDEGALLEEIARSGDAVVGLPLRALARFEEASVLADGRVLFGATFMEENAGASLFVGRGGQAPIALGAEAVRDGKAPWPTTSPAVAHLVAEPDGRFAFLKPGEGVVLADVDRPLEAKLLAPGVHVYQRIAGEDGKVRLLGGARDLSRPTLAQGGDWLLVGARLDDGRRALLLLSRDDVDKGVAEAVLVEDQALPPAPEAAAAKRGKKRADPPADPGSIRSLTLYEWRRDPVDVTSP